MRRIGAFDKIRYSHRILRGYNFQIVAGRDEVRQKIANDSMRSSYWDFAQALDDCPLKGPDP